MFNKNDPDIDVDDLMEKIRAEVVKRHSSHMTNNSTVRVPEFESSRTSEIGNYLHMVQQHAAVGSTLPPMHKMNGLKRRLAQLVGKLTLRVAQIITRDQRTVNQNLYNAVRTLNEDMQGIKNSLQEYTATKVNVSEVEAQLEKLQHIEKRLWDFSVQEAKRVEGHLRNELTSLKDLLEAERNESLNMEERLQKKLDKEVSILRDLVCQVREIAYKLRTQIFLQERRLSLLLEEARCRLPESFNNSQLQSYVNELPGMLDGLYVEFEDQFRGNRDDIKNRLRFYLPFIQQANAGSNDRPVIDIGCGRGEWLEVLQESGFIGRGVDINQVMIELCRQKGFDVTKSDAIAFLKSLPDSSVGAVTGFHIAEHLAFEDLIRLLDESLRVLKPGGVVIFETPNPHNLIVGACNFYADPTHRNPLHPDTFKFLVEVRGFIRVGVEYWSKHKNEGIENILDGVEVDSPESVVLKRLNEIISEWFQAPADYAVIGWRP